MGNIIVILIIGLIAFFAVKSSLKHFRGQGGCCGDCCRCGQKHKANEEEK